MAAIRFATTQLRGLHAAGRTSDLQHSLISAMLARHLGERYAHLLAEFEVRGSDSRDWFVPSQPVPVRISDLAPERQAVLRTECRRMIAAINQLATTIEAQGINGRNLARVLRDATVYPEEDLWEYKGAPLILNWGFRRSQAHSSNPVVIAEEIAIGPPEIASEPVAKAPTDQPVTPKKTRFPWDIFRKRSHLLLWSLFVALLSSIYALLLPACGLSFSFLPDREVGNCHVSGVSQALTLEGIRLQRQIELAELDLARQQNMCARPQPARQADNGTEFNKDVQSRIPAGTPRGGTEIALFWQGTADLDLIIECPDGATLWRSDRNACNGKLLQDMNMNEQSLTSTPIEYATWSNAPPEGTYKIYVELFAYRTAISNSTIPFKIGIKSPTGLKFIEGREISGRGTRILAATEAF
jgi:hypothetical protein